MNAVNTSNTTYRYQLDKSSKKVRCTACGQKTAVLYVDVETNEFMPDVVQRCDRENNCGHHYTPKQYFTDYPDKKPTQEGNSYKNTSSQDAGLQPPPIEYIPISYVEKSTHGFKSSHFAEYIISLFGEVAGPQLLLKYLVGRSKNDNGKACVFWQIDENINVRYGKIMSYDAVTGKRRKDIAPMAVPVKPSNYLQTFFGCHLLTEHPNKPVAIVESEKTAIIASFFMPQYNWLATGGSSGCKWREYQVYKVLQCKEVVLFPDFGYYSRSQSKPKEEWKRCYEEWYERAENISEKLHCKISVSRILENNLPEDLRDSGPDLADFLIKQDQQTGIALTDDDYPAIWDYKILKHSYAKGQLQ
jgi:hypothetical protein